MNSMVKGGILLVVALMAATYFMAGDAFTLGDDYINDLTMLGAVAIIGITVFVSLNYINKIKNDTATGELAPENWDGIGEYTNPVPFGWAIIFMGTIVWMMWYLFVGYPTNQFSQIGQYNEEVNEYNKKFLNKWENIDEGQMAKMGQSVFFVQCAPCHGAEADGMNGNAQDLTVRMSKEQILDVIKNGSNRFGYGMGAMPPGMASGEGAEKIATWIAGGMKGDAPAEFGACSSCHGPDGKGMNGMSANLATYDEILVEKVIKHGKIGVIGTMPSFTTLNETQVKAVSAYLQSIQGE